MILVTTDEIPGRTIKKTLGLVRGNTIRARHVGHDISAALRNLVGGEIRDYTKMMAESREQALDRLVEEAESLCRNIAIINSGKIVEKSGMSSLLRRLHAQSFVLTSHQPIASTEVLADYYPKLLDDTTLEVCLQQDRGMNQMFADLSDAGIEISGLRNKQNRLEQLFIEMVSGDH